jgi:ATP-dependent Clp protease ATP-binding subunit ClpA
MGKLPALLILWSMLRSERKVGVVALEKCGVDLASLEREVEAELEPLSAENWRNGIDLAHFQAVANRAVKEAAQFEHNYVGSEHLVLALCRDPDEVVQRLLQKRGVSAERYTAAVRSVLNHGSNAEETRI